MSNVFKTHNSVLSLTPGAHAKLDTGGLILPKTKRPRRGRHPGIKGLDKSLVIGDISIEDIHALICGMTNPEDFGFDAGEGRRYYNTLEYHAGQHGPSHINYDRLLEWYATDKWDWLYYTGATEGPTWITIDVDEHEGQTDGGDHLADILQFLDVSDPFTFRTRNGLQSVLRYEGGDDNRRDLKALRSTVQAKGKLNNDTGLYASTVEIKGVPAKWIGSMTPHGLRSQVITHGTLARIPQITTLAEAETLCRINLTRARLLEMVDVPPGRGKRKQQERKHRTKAPPQPVSAAKKGDVPPGRGKSKQQGRKHTAEAHENATSPDARLRMIHAKCEHVRRHKALPPDAVSLASFYVSLGLNRSGEDHSPARLARASSVLSFAASEWVEGLGGRKALAWNAELFASRMAYLSATFTREQIADAKKVNKTKRAGVSHLELAAFEIVALSLEVPDRDGIKETLNRWHEEGFLPFLFDNHKLAAIVAVARELGILVHTEHTRPKGERKGVARRFRPGVHGLGFVEWSKLRKAEDDRVRLAAEALVPDLDAPEGEDVVEELPKLTPDDFACIEEALAVYIRQRFYLEQDHAEWNAECDSGCYEAETKRPKDRGSP